MTEIYKSEAVHSLPTLVWSVFVMGAMSVMSLTCACVAYTHNASYIVAISAACLAVLFFFRARVDYRKLHTFIHCPPNSQIVSVQSLTSKK